MATKAEIQAKIDALNAEMAGADEDTEILVQDAKGHVTRLSGPLARKWLAKLGLDDDAPAGEGEQGEGEQGDPEPPKRELRARFFNSDKSH